MTDCFTVSLLLLPQCYLGHSVMAPVGRWQKDKDLHWYNKAKGGSAISADAVARAEREALKRQDEDAINAALGLAPASSSQHGPSGADLDEVEKSQLLARGGAERDGLDVERVQGLGAAPSKGHDHLPQLSLKERELARRQAAEERANARLRESDIVQVVGRGESIRPARDDEKGDGDKSLRKALKKERKKGEKKMRKERKKEKKEKKERKGGDSRDRRDDGDSEEQRRKRKKRRSYSSSGSDSR